MVRPRRCQLGTVTEEHPDDGGGSESGLSIKELAEYMLYRFEVRFAVSPTESMALWKRDWAS